MLLCFPSCHISIGGNTKKTLLHHPAGLVAPFVHPFRRCPDNPGRVVLQEIVKVGTRIGLRRGPAAAWQLRSGAVPGCGCTGEMIPECTGPAKRACAGRTFTGKKKKRSGGCPDRYFRSSFRGFTSGLGFFLGTLSWRIPSFIIPSAFAGSTSSGNAMERSNAE